MPLGLMRMPQAAALQSLSHYDLIFVQKSNKIKKIDFLIGNVFLIEMTRTIRTIKTRRMYKLISNGEGLLKLKWQRTFSHNGS